MVEQTESSFRGRCFMGTSASTLSTMALRCDVGMSPLLPIAKVCFGLFQLALWAIADGVPRGMQDPGFIENTM